MDIKKLLKSFTKEDYLGSKVNLHIHTNLSDGVMTPDEVLKQAKKCGMEHIAITDHNNVLAHNKIQDEILIPAVEFDCFHKMVLVHILGYGIDVNSPALSPFLAKSERETRLDIARILSLRNTKKVIDAIHEAGGAAVFAHPACSLCLNLDKFTHSLIQLGIDGMEVYYPYHRHRKIFKFHSREKVKEIARKYNLIMTGGTDEHGKNLLES